MADRFDDFNYDGDDIELDEFGLPIEEDEYESEDSSSQDLMNMIRRQRGEYDDDESDEAEDDEDDEDDSNDYDNNRRRNKKDSSKNSTNKQKGEGGRYGDNPPTQNQNLGRQQTGPGSSGSGASTASGTTSATSTGTGSAGAGTGAGASTGASASAGTGATGAGAGAGAGAAGAGAGAAGAGAAGAGAAGAGAAGAGGAAAAGGIAAGGWVLLIILAVILLIILIVAIVAYFQAKTDPANMSTNEHVTSEYFYGTRSVYIDDVALSNSLQASYKQYAINVIETIEETHEITVFITIPELDEKEILTNDKPIDQHITNLSIGIASICSTAGSSTQYENIDFKDLYTNIEYFGLTETEQEQVTEFIIEYLSSKSLLSNENGSSYTETIDKSKINNASRLQYITHTRCEKVMIKDEIASSTGLSGIIERKYIASIYMPNKDISIDSASYIISSTSAEFNCISKLISENNSEQTILKEKETKDNRDMISGFLSGAVTVTKFTAIDEENLFAFGDGISLFDILQTADYINYFTLDTNTNAYSWKPNCESLYYLTFEENEGKPFIFTDSQLKIKE